MGAAFVFLHVGADATLPGLLVRSLRRLHPDADIVQCTDRATPVVPGVDMVHRLDGDTGNLMTFRLAAFASLDWRVPALYLDTDMLCVRAIDPEGALAGGEVAVCRREFHVDRPMNTNYRGLDLSKYTGLALGEVYPYVACATITRDGSFWSECLADLSGLDATFHRWYGDQEAIRNVVRAGKRRFVLLPESVYGCTPEQTPETPPCLLHFKGARKAQMLEYAGQLGIA